MKALVTGGGFIALALAKNLVENGYDVTVYGIERIPNAVCEYVPGDIRDFDSLKSAATRAEVIFHLAGVLGTDYLCNRVLEAIDINIKGMVHVLESARIIGAKVINVGLIPEWDSPYMITKKAAMRFARMYWRYFDVRATTLEVTHVYGPGQRLGPYKKAVPTFITNALSGNVLEVYGSGQRIMDCIYISDFAEILRRAGECPDVDGTILKVASGHQISVRALAENIVSLTNSCSQIKYLPMRLGEPEDTAKDEWLNPECMEWQSILKYCPPTTLQEGLLNTIAWYSTNRGARPE